MSDTTKNLIECVDRAKENLQLAALPKHQEEIITPLIEAIEVLGGAEYRYNRATQVQAAAPVETKNTIVLVFDAEISPEVHREAQAAARILVVNGLEHLLKCHPATQTTSDADKQLMEQMIKGIRK